MADLDPILTVLLFASVAASAAALGALPRALLGRTPKGALGLANALAAGLMLGVAYALLTTGLGTGVAAGGIGAAIGLATVQLGRAATATADISLTELGETDAAYGYQVVLVNALHAAWEGVAIGVAMLLSLPFGISMAIALGVHNVPEGMTLTTILDHRGVRVTHAAGLAVVANLNQVLLAVVTYAVVGSIPGLMPWVVGFAAGALVYLVLAELLPESYEHAGETGIALVTLAAMGIVVALAG